MAERHCRPAALIVAVLTALLVLAVAPAASAHATLLYTSPVADQGTVEPPHAITLVFGEPVTLDAHPVRLHDSAGHAIALGTAATGHGGATVTVPVNADLASGIYTVDWQVVSGDGDAVTGTFRFGVGSTAALAASGGSGTGTKGLLPTSVGRFTVFVALAALLGGSVATVLARRRSTLPSGGVAVVPPMPWRGAALLGVAGAALLAVAQAGSGSVTGGISLSALARLPDSTPGRITLIELAAFALAALLLTIGKPRPARVAVFSSALVVAAEAWRAHPEAQLPIGGALLTAVHVAAAATWVGALVWTLRVCLAWRAEVPDTAWQLLGDYARLAIGLVAVVVVTGTLSGLLVVPVSKLLSTGYGQILLIKIAVVAVAIGLAATARYRLLRRRDPVPLIPARWEAIALIGVLGVTAVLVTTAPPTGSSRLSFAPPPAGPVLPLGARAGQIGITVEASTGQAVIRLFVPETDAHTTFKAGARLTDPSGVTTTLRLRDCGTGCFTTGVSWPTGASVLSLQAGATGWTGGTASVIVDWPTDDGTTALHQVTDTLVHTKELVIAEKVTSDTTGPSSGKTVYYGGPAFLHTEPYSDGAPEARVRADGPGRRLLALGYPAQNIQVLLTIDDTGRILSETLTDPTHLTVRTFDYIGQNG